MQQHLHARRKENIANTSFAASTNALYGSGTELRAWDGAFDGSGSDGEASTVPSPDAHASRVRRTKRRASVVQNTRPMEPRRPFPKRQPNPLAKTTMSVDGVASEDMNMHTPKSVSRLGGILEAVFFFALVAAVVYKMYRSGNTLIHAKIPELLLLAMFCAVCFATHWGAPYILWATRVQYLRKSVMSDGLYALLLAPILVSLMMLDAMAAQPGPLAPALMGLDTPGAWRVKYLPLGDPYQWRDPVWIAWTRRVLMDKVVLYGTVIGIHVCASAWHPRRNKTHGRHFTVESLSKAKQFAFFLTFALCVSIGIGVAKWSLGALGYPTILYGDLSVWKTSADTFLFQCVVYVFTRVARQNFTIGELGIASSLLTPLLSEAFSVTAYKLAQRPSMYDLSVARAPTALMAFQHALIIGIALIGLLLSPVLALSRVLAQRPTHRLRWPDKRNMHRRLLALGFFVIAAVLVFGTISPWVSWVLGRKNPWIYLARFMLEGPYLWSRPALLLYWGTLCNIALLSLQLMVNRVWQFATVGDQIPALVKRRAQNKKAKAKSRSTLTASELASTLAASQFADPHTDPEEETALGPTLTVSVNGRRKFFHMLATFLFVPATAWDPAFMALGYNSAFSLFLFLEYLRYCAVYPVGASLHFLLSQFLDSKDTGLVIVSHLYLLAGCAAGIWTEARSPLLLQLGTIILGVGDACASIVGRQYGRYHWPMSAKTIEGTAAFFISVLSSMFLLRILRMVEPFNVANMTIISLLLAFVEGVSEQNDNLILPVVGLVLGSLFPVS
ncbi:dolichol kinase [Malassezia vespertilionis]|uniref:dolichol kinase n=1 Tax=Malassezia vespertilionis TaxID=2020962 RepID=A0A2N1JGI7_9BASI|nr:dolichol kinase [Malassezia vespertilionis]PKI85649.1 hypothetical protein MVES_000497 [Malassezia vespertilionis]WFD05211.1 dolichol kinase [Malassezia vespertilionis]